MERVRVKREQAGEAEIMDGQVTSQRVCVVTLYVSYLIATSLLLSASRIMLLISSFEIMCILPLTPRQDIHFYGAAGMWIQQGSKPYLRALCGMTLFHHRDFMTLEFPPCVDRRGFTTDEYICTWLT